MADTAAPVARLTYHHQVVLNLTAFIATADWQNLNIPLARAEIAARLAMAPLTGQPQVDAVLSAAARLDADPASLLRARAAVAQFLFWRAAQAQALADAPKDGTDNAA